MEKRIVTIASTIETASIAWLWTKSASESLQAPRYTWVEKDWNRPVASRGLEFLNASWNDSSSPHKHGNLLARVDGSHGPGA